MKYKNYRNPYTNDNRIYSDKGLYKPFGEFIKRRHEVLGQYRVLGIPTEKELKGSDNVVYVEAYTREDGTEVKAHYRSKPKNGSVNNESKTTLKETAAEENEQQKVKQENKTEEQTNKEQEQQEPEPTEKEQDIDKLLYPDEIAGVKRGEPMTFEEADSGNVNPNIYNQDDSENDYYNNCQCCVIAYEARRRGYNVEAGPYVESGTTGELGKKTIFGAWIDADTGEVCEIGTEIDVIGRQDCYNELENEVKQGERYALVDAHFVEQEGEDKRVDAHVRVIERDNDGNLIMYDPQDGGIRKGDDMKKKKGKTMFTKPLEGKITSNFGYRKSPVAGASTNHSGIDIGVPVGTPVKAIADGTVIAANGGMRGYGNGIFINHGIINGKRIVSEYGHLSEFLVNVGNKIKQGQIIAKSGNTGISSGPHLHLTIRENNIPVDPKKYINFDAVLN